MSDCILVDPGQCPEYHLRRLCIDQYPDQPALLPREDPGGEVRLVMESFSSCPDQPGRLFTDTDVSRAGTQNLARQSTGNSDLTGNV